MDIAEITDDMIGKKITCYIKEVFIDDGEITKEGDSFFILQNKKNGAYLNNRKGYKYSWLIKFCEDPGYDSVKELKLKKTSIELWI